MNILLWVLQIALALLCISGGAFQIFKIEELQKTVAAMRELPRGLWAFLGAFGCLAGLGLILPGATKVLPVVTPIAAAAVAAESVQRGNGDHGGVHFLRQIRAESILG